RAEVHCTVETVDARHCHSRRSRCSFWNNKRGGVRGHGKVWRRWRWLGNNREVDRGRVREATAGPVDCHGKVSKSCACCDTKCGCCVSVRCKRYISRAYRPSWAAGTGWWSGSAEVDGPAEPAHACQVDV